MIATLLGSLSFNAPLILAAFTALPVIWWLLRMTPPRPQSVPFPPASLLLGLKPKERTPIRSPWWLTAMRILIAAAVIAALSGPVLKPPSSAAAAGAQHPLLVVVDNGWAAASRWASRRSFAEQLASQAQESGQTLYIAATAGAALPLQPLTPAEFRQRFASLSPHPYSGDRAALALQLGKELGQERGKLRVAWLADGLEDQGAGAMRDMLRELAEGGIVDFYTDDGGGGPLGVTGPMSGHDGMRARILKSESDRRSGQIAAVTARGERLAILPFEIAGSSSAAEIVFDLPLDLRNQVSRFEIVGEASAGGVFLLDGRSLRRRVGLIASEDAEEAQPLLSPSYYLERALAPFAEVLRPRTANLDQATAELVTSAPSVIILSDVGRLTGAPRERLREFVEKGGMLLRFAGPRLEQGGDNLLPAPLREGGRMLGGAMTWTSPQTPAPFEQGSPFEGFAIPKDVTISRQVLADPAAMPRGTEVWARLADGTPLVTAARRGSGLLVFFHITANPNWSNLPISGLFVEMMRKTLELSPLQVRQGNDANPPAGETQSDTAQETILKPWRVLDGFGKLVEPGEHAQSISATRAEKVRASATNPAGLYGPQSALRAINVVEEGDTLSPLKPPDGARSSVFAEAKSVELAPWLFLGAFALFLLDGIVCAMLLGRSALGWRRPATAAVAFLALLGLTVPKAQAETPRDTSASAAVAFALKASLETRLAYVLTGNAEADRISHAGLMGLSKILTLRTAVEPGEPMGIDPARDELVFFPLIYWPVLPNSEPLAESVLAKIDAYMKQGGLIIFDTKNDETLAGTLSAPNSATPLAQLLGKLDLPPLQRLPEDHVLTKAFYLLQSFPGRWDNGDPWVEARTDAGDVARRGVKSDGVSSIIVTSNDLAAAWALDESDRPMFAVVPGGEEQREMSYRVGVNIVMYALTGNYKADQVHVPAILERLGH